MWYTAHQLSHSMIVNTIWKSVVFAVQKLCIWPPTKISLSGVIYGLPSAETMRHSKHRTFFMCVQFESLCFITNSCTHDFCLRSVGEPNDCLHQSEKSRLSGCEGGTLQRNELQQARGRVCPVPLLRQLWNELSTQQPGALEDFQFHFYGIWFLSAYNLSPFIVHAINSRQVYKLLFKLRCALVVPMTNTIQMELYIYFFCLFASFWNSKIAFMKAIHTKAIHIVHLRTW